MRIQSTTLAFVSVILLLVAVASQALAATQNADDHIASFTSASVGPFVALGELSLLTDGSAGKQEAFQGAKALLATGLFTEALKYAVREKRPTGTSLSSFPSGHTSEAFAMATVLGEYKPKYKLMAYGAATAIGWSRVETRAHFAQDVVAGGLLGYYVAKHFTNEHIVPTGNGLAFQWKW